MGLVIVALNQSFCNLSHVAKTFLNFSCAAMLANSQLVISNQLHASIPVAQFGNGACRRMVKLAAPKTRERVEIIRLPLAISEKRVNQHRCHDCRSGGRMAVTAQLPALLLPSTKAIVADGRDSFGEPPHTT